MKEKWLLVGSNVSYLIPTGVVWYNMMKKGRRTDAANGAELISVFLFLTFFASWGYHSCRADIEAGKPCSGTLLNTIAALPGSKEIKFDITKFIDHLTAILTLILVMINSIPLSDKTRKSILIVSIIWVLLFLSAENDLLAIVPAVLAFLIITIFWFYIRHAQTGNRNVTWALALIFMFISLLAFQVHEPYWLYHSLWHVFGAISAAFLLFNTAACYEDMEDVELPAWMRAVFTDPCFCTKYDHD